MPSWDALTALALRPVGGLGTGDAPPRKIPDTTALSPAVRATVTVTVPPAATLSGTLTQAPSEKRVGMAAVLGGEPSLAVMVSRRPSLSQSRASTSRVRVYA